MLTYPSCRFRDLTPGCCPGAFRGCLVSVAPCDPSTEGVLVCEGGFVLHPQLQLALVSKARTGLREQPRYAGVVCCPVPSLGLLVRELGSDQPASNVCLSVWFALLRLCLALRFRPLVFLCVPRFLWRMGYWLLVTGHWLGVPWKPIRSKQKRLAQNFSISMCKTDQCPRKFI